MLRSLLSRRLSLRSYTEAKTVASDVQAPARSLVRACKEAGLLEEESMEETKWLPAEELLQIWFAQKVDDLADAGLQFDPAAAFGVRLPQTGSEDPGAGDGDDAHDEGDPFWRVCDYVTVLFDLWRLQSKVYAYTAGLTPPGQDAQSQDSRLQPCVCGFEPPSPSLVLKNHERPNSAAAAEDEKQRLLFMSAEYAVVLAESLGIKFLISPEDIIEGQRRLNFAFLADAYNRFAGLEHELLAFEPDEHASEQKSEPKKDVSEAEAFANWINSLRLSINLEDPDGTKRPKKIVIRDLLSELKDGLALLALLDHIQPGIVNWRKVELPKPNNDSSGAGATQGAPDPAQAQPRTAASSPKRTGRRRLVKRRVKEKEDEAKSEIPPSATRSKKTAPYLSDDEEERKPLTRIQSVNNCNYGVKLCKQLGMSLVNVGGVDLVSAHTLLSL